MSRVKILQATVYKGGGRRWFTKAAAIRAEANALIRKRCQCYRGSGAWDDPPETCGYHDQDRYPQLIARLIRHLTYNESK